MARWETADLRLATFLRASGYKLVDAKKKDRVVMFEFNADDTLCSLVKQYHNRETRVEPLNYMAIMGELRDLIRQVDRGETMAGGNHARA